jgi:cytohesin
MPAKTLKGALYKARDIAGVDVNAKDKTGETPLHYAAFNGEWGIAELLIAEGADVNAESENGVAGGPISVFLVGGIIRKTPLDVAIMRSHTEIADLLRKHGGKRGVELKAEGK